MNIKSLSSIRYKNYINDHTLMSISDCINDLYFASTYIITTGYSMKNYIDNSNAKPLRSYKYTGRKKMYDFAIDYIRKSRKRLSIFKNRS